MQRFPYDTEVLRVHATSDLSHGATMSGEFPSDLTPRDLRDDLARLRGRYLDLMVKSLSDTLYDRPSGQAKPAVDSEADRVEGRVLPEVAHTMVGVLRLNNLRELTERAIVEKVPGHFIETGVWRGGCCILMKAMLAAHGDTHRRVYVADSFRGLPPPRPELYPVDRGDQFHTYDQLRVSADQVRANFSRYGLLDERVVFVEGFFHETLPRLDAAPFAVIRLDGDMYESTIVALETLYPKLSAGGFVVIDDYGGIPACRSAVTDFRRTYDITDEIQEIDWTGVWWRKAGTV